MYDRNRPAPLASIVVSVICLALFIIMLMSGCERGQRADTLHTSLIAVNAARDGFTAWDHAHQQSLVDGAVSRETGAAALASYRDQRRAWLDGFEVAYRALAVAATQSDDLSLQAALTAAGNLVTAVTALIKEM